MADKFSHFVPDDEQQQFSHFVPDENAAPPDVPKAPTPKMEESTLGKVYGSFHPEGGPAIERALTPKMHDSAQGIAGNIATGIGNFAKGAGHILTHPEDLVTGAVQSLPPVMFAKSVRDAYKHMQGQPNETDERIAHPMENLEYTAGQMAPFVLAGAAEKLPSMARAGATLQDIRTQAADVPVAPTNAWPEIQRFKELVAAGGKGSRPITQLSKRMTNMVRDPNAGSFNFPEARDFYSNVSDASHASTLSKLMGTAPKPVMLRQLGAIRSAFNEDLTNAAQRGIGRGEDYANAMSEYAKAAKLKSAAIKGGGMAAGVALGHSLPGRILSKFVPTR